MPIDYLSNRNIQDQSVTDLIENRNVEDELARTLGSVRDSRNNFLNKADTLISGVNPASRSSLITRSSILDKDAQFKIAQQKLALQRQKMTAIFNNAFDQATRAGYEVKDAQDYARKIAIQSTQQDFEATEAAKKREAALKQEALRNEYANRGVQLENQYQPNVDYTGALLRVLLGTGTAVATNKYLDYKREKQDAINSRQRYVSPDYTSNVAGTNPDFDPYYEPSPYTRSGTKGFAGTGGR